MTAVSDAIDGSHQILCTRVGVQVERHLYAINDYY